MAAAAWPLVAQIGGGLLGGLLGRSGSRGRTAEEKTSINDLLGANQLAFRRAEGLAPQGEAFLSKGAAAFDPAVNYWSKILSGDRGEINTLLGPEISRISQNYEGAAKAGSQFAPAGGGRSQLLAEMPFQRGRDISSLVAGLRPQAAQQLSTIANQLSALGLDAEQIINQILTGIGQRGGGLLDYGLAERGKISQGTALGAYGGAQIGRSIYDILNKKD